MGIEVVIVISLIANALGIALQAYIWWRHTLIAMQIDEAMTIYQAIVDEYEAYRKEHDNGSN